MSRPRIAILDDSHGIAATAADWSKIKELAELVIFDAPLGDLDQIAATLQPFSIIVPMRERTAFSATLIERLPNLKMIALTGVRAPTLDLAACTKAGIVVSNTGSSDSTASTAELAWALVMACARSVPASDATMRAGGWHQDLPLGTILAGKRLGIVGLGKLGLEVARFGRAFGMDVVAWSQNLTAEAAAVGGARLVAKSELFETADVVSVHLVLSDRSRGVVGPAELAAMKSGAILVNTSRGPLVDEAALLAALETGRLRAGLDVFDIEPLPADHPLRRTRNVVLTPHLGYVAQSVLQQFYTESVENILAFLDGNPVRVINPDVMMKLASAQGGDPAAILPQAHRPTM